MRHTHRECKLTCLRPFLMVAGFNAQATVRAVVQKGAATTALPRADTQGRNRSAAPDESVGPHQSKDTLKSSNKVAPSAARARGHLVTLQPCAVKGCSFPTAPSPCPLPLKGARGKKYTKSRAFYNLPLASGESPSGKAAAFGAAIRRFDPFLPNQAATLFILLKELIIGKVFFEYLHNRSYGLITDINPKSCNVVWINH